MKKAPRSGAKEETKRRVSTKKKTVRKPKPAKPIQLGQEKDLEEIILEHSDRMDEEAREIVESLRKLTEELAPLVAEDEECRKATDSLVEVMRGWANIMPLMLKSNPQNATSFIVMLLSIGINIQYILVFLFQLYPDIVKSIAEQWYTWPMLWRPTKVGRERVYADMAHLNIGKTCSFSLNTADHSDAQITEIATIFHQILSEIRSPLYVKMFDHHFRLNACVQNFIESLDRLAQKIPELRYECAEYRNLDDLRPKLIIADRQAKVGYNAIKAAYVQFYLVKLRSIFGQPPLPALAVFERFEKRCLALPPPTKETSKAWGKVGLDLFKYITGGEPEKCEELEQVATSQMPDTNMSEQVKLRAKRNAINNYFKTKFLYQLQIQPGESQN